MLLVFTSLEGCRAETVSFFFFSFFLSELPPANWPRLVCEEGSVAFEEEELPTSSREEPRHVELSLVSRLIFSSSSGLGNEIKCLVHS